MTAPGVRQGNLYDAYTSSAELASDFLSAAERGDVVMLQALKPPIPDPIRLQALKTCALKGDVEAVKVLLHGKDSFKVVVEFGSLPCVMALFDHLKETLYVKERDEFQHNFGIYCREILAFIAHFNRGDVISEMKLSDTAKLALRHLGDRCLDEPFLTAASLNNLNVFKELYPSMSIDLRQEAYNRAIQSDKILQFLQTAPENGLDIKSILAQLKQGGSNTRVNFEKLLSRIDPTQSKLVFQFTAP